MTKRKTDDNGLGERMERIEEAEGVSRETAEYPHPSPLPGGEGTGAGGEGTGDEGGSYGRYVALVMLDQGGTFVLPGEEVTLERATATALLALGLVADA